MKARNDCGQGTRYFDEKRQRYVYEVRYKTRNGSHKRKKIVSKSRKELSMKIKNWQVEYKKSLSGYTHLTVKEVSTIWLNAIRPNIKLNTFYQYKYAINFVVKEYGSRQLDSLQSIEIQMFLNTLYEKSNLSPRTVNIVRNTFRNMCGFAVRNHFIIQNPLLVVKTIRDEHNEPPWSLTEAQLHKLLTIAKEGEYYPGNNIFSIYLKKEFYAAITLATRTGMRRGEVFGLDWSNIDFEQHLLTVHYTLLSTRKRTSPKTKSSIRTILLDNDTLLILKRWYQYQYSYDQHYHGIYNNPQNYIFTTAHGTPISLDNFRERHWNALCKAAGLPGFGFHGLRHTHATLLLKAGVNVKVVAERLGHADVAITMRTYAHVLPTMQQSAIEAIKKISGHVAARPDKDSD